MLPRVAESGFEGVPHGGANSNDLAGSGGRGEGAWFFPRGTRAARRVVFHGFDNHVIGAAQIASTGDSQGGRRAGAEADEFPLWLQAAGKGQLPIGFRRD